MLIHRLFPLLLAVALLAACDGHGDHLTLVSSGNTSIEDGAIEVSGDRVTLHPHHAPEAAIGRDGDFAVNGKAVDVTAAERALLADYYAGARAVREHGIAAVARLAHHPRVQVAEELDPVDAQDPGRLVHLGGAPHGQLLALGQDAGHRFAQLAAGGEDQHPAVAGVGGPQEGGAGGDRLVVRVGVEADDGPHEGSDATADLRRWPLGCRTSHHLRI